MYRFELHKLVKHSHLSKFYNKSMNHPVYDHKQIYSQEKMRAMLECSFYTGWCNMTIMKYLRNKLEKENKWWNPPSCNKSLTSINRLIYYNEKPNIKHNNILMTPYEANLNKIFVHCTQKEIDRTQYFINSVGKGGSPIQAIQNKGTPKHIEKYVENIVKTVYKYDASEYLHDNHIPYCTGMLIFGNLPYDTGKLNCSHHQLSLLENISGSFDTNCNIIESGGIYAIKQQMILLDGILEQINK